MVRHNEKSPSKSLDLQAVEDALRVFFTGEPDILLAYLFGSLLHKEKRPFRDIDIAVLVVPHRLRALHGQTRYGYGAYLSSTLARHLQYDHIDLVLLNEASPLLLRQVIGKGRLVFYRSEMDRISFEVASLKRHADTAHLRKIKRLYMKRRIQRGLAAYA